MDRDDPVPARATRLPPRPGPRQRPVADHRVRSRFQREQSERQRERISHTGAVRPTASVYNGTSVNGWSDVVARELVTDGFNSATTGHGDSASPSSSEHGSNILEEMPATGLRAYHARMATMPQSTFMHLTDAEFQSGLLRLEADAEAEPVTRPRPVVERYDVVVLASRPPLFPLSRPCG